MHLSIFDTELAGWVRVPARHPARHPAAAAAAAPPLRHSEI